MARSQWIKWVHRIGYATTILVIVEVIWIGRLAFVQWHEDSRMRASVIEESRTHEGPLTVEEPRFRPDYLDLLENMPPLPAAPRQGLRFVAMPSLRGLWFAYSITIEPQSKRGNGTLLAYKQSDGTSVFERHFSISAAAGRRYLAAFDNLTRGWKGSLHSLCLDGTGVAFELRSTSRVTSGRGNSACDAHYGAVARLALAPVRSLIPKEYRPDGADWRTRTKQN